MGHHLPAPVPGHRIRRGDRYLGRDSLAQTAKKPNILVIFGDDVGVSNLSAYTHGLVGYQTPNIDRIAKEGMMFTDYYAENSSPRVARRSSPASRCCPPGFPKSAHRAPRWGCKKGISRLRGAEAARLCHGSVRQEPSWATATSTCRPRMGSTSSSATSTTSNAEEEPERPYWPKDDTAFVKALCPRGVLHSFAKGKTEDTGPLNRKRMETIDDETSDACRTSSRAGQGR